MVACLLALKGQEVLPRTVLDVPDVTHRNIRQRCKNFLPPQVFMSACMSHVESGELCSQESQS